MQASLLVAPRNEVVIPSVQLVQSDCPVVVEYAPIGHAMQPGSLPPFALNSPAPHASVDCAISKDPESRDCVAVAMTRTL